MSQITVYPDAGAGGTTVDGHVKRSIASGTWSDIHDGAGTYKDDTVGANALQVGVFSTTTTDEYSEIVRAIYLFDTSAIGASSTIDSSTFRIKGNADKIDQFSGMTVNIYSSNPAANNALAIADYGTCGTTVFATAIAFANWANGDNTFTLNTDGKNAISKTSITKLSMREATWDAANTAPTWSSGKSSYVAGNFATGAPTTDPKLVVNYTEASGPANLKSMDTVTKANIKSIDGVAIANIKSINTVT